MEEASLQLTFAFIGLFIGVIIGAFGYRLLSRSQRQLSSIKLDLLEKERQIAERKADMQSHLGSTHRQVKEARRLLTQLEQRLGHQAVEWGLDDAPRTPYDADLLHVASHEPLADDTAYAATPAGPAGAGEPPRDYAADGQGGTLSEGFGLKDNAAAERDPQHFAQRPSTKH
ncbi:hypothetical protein GCM10022228_05220 [Halomonas cibimaris]|uniref:DUF1043 family protein n=1 Tax=Halomonas cibimaris TaxID=657012 RepID=A0ABP7LDT1_9GAMM